MTFTSTLPTCTWAGLPFHAHRTPPRHLRFCPGLYIMSRPIDATKRAAVYVGRADDIGLRHHEHERWSEAVHLGATEVHVHVEWSAEVRERLERQLIEILNPPLNQQHRADPYNAFVAQEEARLVELEYALRLCTRDAGSQITRTSEAGGLLDAFVGGTHRGGMLDERLWSAR
jgi:hypothetical protein